MGTKVTDENLPVGWLVIVNGPDRGHVRTLRGIFNIVGRGQSVPIDDDRIPEECAYLGYNEKEGKFTISSHQKALVYVNDEEISEVRRDLQPLSHLCVGETVLRFVPLCHGDFSWK